MAQCELSARLQDMPIRIPVINTSTPPTMTWNAVERSGVPI